MKWFNGTISEAIRTSRDKKSVFVVVITSEDDESQQLLETLQKEEVGKVFDSFICISLKHGSSEANQFNQLYPIVILPVIYFIGLQGSPIEIIGGAVDVKSLLARSIAALEAHLKQHNVVSEEEPAVANNQCHSVTPSEIADTGSITSAELGTDLIQVEKVPESSNLNTQLESPDQSVNTVRERKKEKRQKEEPRWEQERKESETSIKKFKSKAEEPESCEASQSNHEQGPKENEVKVLRKRVVENKTSIHKSDSKTLTASDQEKPQLEKKSPVNPTGVTAQSGRHLETRNEVTRLQFRLPDGSTRTEVFSSSVKLSKIVEFIESQIKPPFNSYSLCATFPRREFDDLNMQQTLLELDLTPSSALLIVPKSLNYCVQPVSGTSSLSSYLQKILVPFYWVWNFIWVSISNLIPRTPIQPSTGDGQSINQRNSTDQRVRPPRYNIHRLPNSSPEDSSDDNATWNGNSTQQL